MTSNIEGAERVYEKALDYAVIYADGVIVKPGGDRVCRLIFYQEHLEPAPDGKDIDRNKKLIKMKFEVRMPERTAVKVSQYITNHVDLRRQALDMTEGNDDPKITEVWWKFNNRLSNSIFDTELVVQDTKGTEALTEEFLELVGRTGKIKPPNNNSDKIANNQSEKKSYEAK